MQGNVLKQNQICFETAQKHLSRQSTVSQFAQ